MKNKTLVVSTWAPPMIGGPMNLYNLFSQFPDDSYNILTSYAAVTEPPHKTEYWLDGLYVFYDRTDLIDPVEYKKATNSDHGQAKIKWWSKIASVLVNIFNYKGIGRLLLFIPHLYRIVRIGTKTVRKNNIDVLMGVSGDGLAMIATYLIHKITRKPYTLFLFDIYRGNMLVPALRLLARFAEPLLFKNATKIFLTNKGTVNLYRSRYGDLPYEIIYNAVFPDKYKEEFTEYNPVSPFSIIFTGYIYWPQERSVLNLIRAVKSIKDIDIQLKLYSPKVLKSIKDAIVGVNNISLTSAPPSEMPQIQSQADILFLPLSWYTQSHEIIQTATPGKLTDYLIAGRPILIHAPPDAYVSIYTRENKCAHVVDQEDIKKIQDGIRKLVIEPDYSRRLISNARTTFYRNHDAIKIAKQLTLALDSI